MGYSAEPAGLFGFQTRYRPIVAPVEVSPVTYVQPIYRSTSDPYAMPTVRYEVPVTKAYYAPSSVYLPRY